MNDERAKMEERARQRIAEGKPFDAPFYSVDFVESEVLRALRECAKLVCEGCRQGHPIVNNAATGQWHQHKGTFFGSCYAAPIHAKIAEMSKP